MPSEQSPPSNASPARHRSSEKDQRPPSTGGVRGLLGLPMRASGVLSTAPLTAPPRGHHYGQPPLLASGESDESFREGALDEGWSEEGGSASADSQSDIPGAVLHGGASLPITKPGNPVDTRSTTIKMPAEQREQTSFVIPGVSTHRIAFAALSHTADMAQVAQQAEALETSLDQVVPLHTPGLLPHRREEVVSNSEFLPRLAHLVTEGAKAQHSSEAQRPSVVSHSPSPVEQMGVPHGERGDTDVARRLTQLQRTVSELAATVSAQTTHRRDGSQAQGRERMTPPQRTVVVQRVDASSTTPHAFWERSRLGRLHLRTGR
jgi:hypothetical protein